MSRGLRFSANLKWLFTEMPLVARPGAAAAAGFAAVEHPGPYDISEAHWGQVLRDAGVQQVLLNTPTAPPGSHTEFGAGCVPGAESEFRRGLEQAIAYAVEIDCPMINVMAGVPPAGTTRSEATDTWLTNLAWAADACAGTELHLLVEAVNPTDRPGAFLQRQDDAADLVSRIGSHRIRLLIDFYHCQMMTGDLTHTFHKHAALVGHLQVADVPGRHQPGTGEINYPHLFEQIAASSYSGWIGCEYEPAGPTTDSLGWLITSSMNEPRGIEEDARRRSSRATAATRSPPPSRTPS